MKYKYFTYCPESGFDTHETLEGAIDDANSIIPNYLDEGWSEDVTGVFVGTITHAATMCDKIERAGEVDEDGYDEDGEHWADPDWDYKCDYKMRPVESDYTGLVEALEGLLSITSESYGVTGYHLNGEVAEWGEIEEVTAAEEVLVAFRKLREGSK